jgi:hypothetical protein
VANDMEARYVSAVPQFEFGRFAMT